jgi:hypothetical protein
MRIFGFSACIMGCAWSLAKLRLKTDERTEREAPLR